MTALTAFLRLEATGLWRESPDAQRREVVVSLGDATLILKDMQDRPLAHWSLAAVERGNPGERPALYHPDGDPGESLQLAEDAREMEEAIETLRRAIARSRPRQGRLRLGLALCVAAGIAATAALWLPGALRAHALAVVPEVKRDAIGLSVLQNITLLTGPPCRTAAAAPSLRSLARRVLGPSRGGDLIVLRGGDLTAAHLPGGLVLLDRSTIEDAPIPEVTAGYALVEDMRAAARDPLEALLAHGGAWATARLLTTGDLPETAVADYARHILTEATPAVLPPEDIVAGFAALALPLQPYALAVDRAGGTDGTALIAAAQPQPEGAPAILSDNDWLRLQAICQ